jgi:hypothetical protein
MQRRSPWPQVQQSGQQQVWPSPAKPATHPVASVPPFSSPAFAQLVGRIVPTLTHAQVGLLLYADAVRHLTGVPHSPTPEQIADVQHLTWQGLLDLTLQGVTVSSLGHAVLSRMQALDVR